MGLKYNIFLMLISNITPNVKVNKFYITQRHKEHEVVSTFFYFLCVFRVFVFTIFH